jgi:serine/threonine-protein kinase
MSPERYQQIGELYQQVLQLEASERGAFLAKACDSDEDLRKEVEYLVSSTAQLKSFLNTGALGAAAKLLVNDRVEFSPGQRIHHYEIVAALGAGGMGEVFLADDKKMGRKVALKLLPAHFTQDPQRVRRFNQEAQAVVALNHPNIVSIYDIGQAQGIHFIVTELIEGETLRRRMSGAQLKLSETIDVAIQVNSALVAAHQAGIVHRDIKPENIMLRMDGYVKVLDFGLAKLLEKSASTPNTDSAIATQALVKTGAGEVMGTVGYMSPEQARGIEIDARTDIWSLGVVTYEMASGRLPFEGATPAEAIARIIEREPAPLARYAPELPAELERIITKALTKDRQERYQTAKELLVDLTKLKQRLAVESEMERVHAPAALDASPSGGQLSGKPTSLPAAGVTNAYSISSAEYVVTGIKRHKLKAVVALLLVVAAAAAFWQYRHRSTAVAIDSIAVLPFVNASGNSEVEYLSDGMTDSLIISLSQLPHMSVKSRSSVIRYKGKEVEPQQVAAELSVQAVLSGRVVEHGDDLAVYLFLVDGRTGNQLWGAEYHRKKADLVAVLSETTLDVSQKLRAQLSGTDEQRLRKTYPTNGEAFDLYLKGRYHLHRLTPPEIQTSISYFQQATDIEPSYALSYVGLADAYRTSGLVGDKPPGDFFPKAIAAAQKAVAIDDTLAEAHAELGFTIFWYEWDWRAAETQLKRALELDSNNADAHLFYAHLLSNTGRHGEALAEVKRAKELDPLDLRINGLEAEFLLHAGKADEALAILRSPSGFIVNSWFADMFASAAYIEKGMFAEAVAEARRAREVNSANSQTTATLAYALARFGKQAEAQALLDELLKLSTQRHVSPGNIALIYNGLGQRNETFAWLERGFKERDPKMVFLKVEPKWNNLRDDPRFQNLLQRVGFAP